MSEFDKAKERYERKKRKTNVVEIKPKKSDSFKVTIIDGGNEYTYDFTLGNVKGTRLPSQRNRHAYQLILEELLSREFGKWQLNQTH